jgi:DNA-binding GntR family transcriptional regulator
VTIQQITEARVNLEAIILEKLLPSRIREEDIRELERNVAIAEQHAKENRDRDRLYTDFGFHQKLAEISGNSVIILMHKINLAFLVPFFERSSPTVEMTTKAFKDHKMIIQHLKKGHFDKAAEVCTAHIQAASLLMTEKSQREAVLKRTGVF